MYSHIFELLSCARNSDACHFFVMSLTINISLQNLHFENEETEACWFKNCPGSQNWLLVELGLDPGFIGFRVLSSFHMAPNLLFKLSMAYVIMKVLSIISTIVEMPHHTMKDLQLCPWRQT